MKKIKTNAVHLKFNKTIIYATDSQVEILSHMRNDPEKRNNFVKVGNLTFSPNDISYIESQSRESYDLPKYFLERHKKESSQLITTN